MHKSAFADRTPVFMLACTRDSVLESLCGVALAGATVVIVAHRLVACRRVADSIAVMRAGEVIEVRRITVNPALLTSFHAFPLGRCCCCSMC